LSNSRQVSSDQLASSLISSVRIDGPRRQDTPVSTSARKPDPSKGIFESLLVVRGEPVELKRHLERLQGSLAELYGAELPAKTGERARATAAELDLGRLRLQAAPGDDGLELDLLAQPVDPRVVFPLAPRGAALRRVDRPGGHGSHKWVDRTGMEYPDAGAGQLICDGEELLEAGWANLFAIRRDALWTPPADGRILAGMARSAICEIAREEGLETYEQPLTKEDLLNAEEVFLTNSVRGLEPAVALDRIPLPGSGPISRRLAAALRQRWGLPDDSDAPQAAASAPKADQLSR
jgi:para-aminobenzoate synthetase/4-amino-4-deoxychorismate lyase